MIHSAFIRPSTWHTFFGGKRPFPTTLAVELTNRCNNNCIHCCINQPQSHGPRAERELSTREWKALFRKAAEAGVLNVQISGGEPLLRKDFAELYLHCRKCGLIVDLQTNGRLITPELGELFRDVPLRGYLEITLYGLRPESYEQVSRAPGSYMEAMQGLSILRKNNVPFGLGFSALPPSLDEIKEISQWQKAHGFESQEPSPVNGLYHCRIHRDSREKNTQIQSFRLSPEKILALNEAVPSFWDETIQFWETRLTPGRKPFFICGLEETAFLDPYGYFWPCGLIRDPRLKVKVHPTNLFEAFNEMTKSIQRLKPASKEYFEKCDSCFFRGWCEQCPGFSWTEHGTLDTPVEYLCQDAHFQAHQAGLIAAEERAWNITDWAERLHRLSQSRKSRRRPFEMCTETGKCRK